MEENWRRRLELEELAHTLAYSLWDLGDVEPAEDLARELHDFLWQARGRAWAYSAVYNRARSDQAKTMLRMKRYERAEEIYRELLLHPDADGVAPGLCAYNLACTLCLAGRQEDALSALLEAARYDPSSGELAMEDGDLGALRERYPDLLDRVREAAAEEEGDPVEVEGTDPDAPGGESGR
jgi:tetratricopeptide (TPR) repeat protein